MVIRKISKKNIHLVCGSCVAFYCRPSSSSSSWWPLVRTFDRYWLYRNFHPRLPYKTLLLYRRYYPRYYHRIDEIKLYLIYSVVLSSIIAFVSAFVRHPSAGEGVECRLPRYQNCVNCAALIQYCSYQYTRYQLYSFISGKWNRTLWSIIII